MIWLIVFKYLIPSALKKNSFKGFCIDDLGPRFTMFVFSFNNCQYLYVIIQKIVKLSNFKLRNLSCLLVYRYPIFEISQLFPWSIFIGFHILDYWLFLSEIFALLVGIVCRAGSEKCCQLFEHFHLLQTDEMLAMYCDGLAFSGPLLKCTASNPRVHVQFIFW